jgi:hypothetical protein
MGTDQPDLHIPSTRGQHLPVYGYFPKQAHFLYAGTILLGAIFPILGNLLIFITSRSSLDSHIYLAIFSYSLAIAGFSYGKFNSNLIEATPLTRDAVVEGMDDGWMVVDQHDKIIDLNSSA